MKFLGKFLSVIVKLTVLCAGIVLVLEYIDSKAERNNIRYVVHKEFED